MRSLTIGGPATILNNSKDVIHAGKRRFLAAQLSLNPIAQRRQFSHLFDRTTGDTIAWTFFNEFANTTSKVRAAHGSVRRIGVRVADFQDEVSSQTERIANRFPLHLILIVSKLVCLFLAVQDRTCDQFR